MRQTAHFFFCVHCLSYSMMTSEKMLATAPMTPMISKIKALCTPLRDISRRSYTHASIPLKRDARQPSFLTSTAVVAGFHAFIVPDSTGPVNAAGNFVKLPRKKGVAFSAKLCIIKNDNRIIHLQGGVKVPTGGDGLWASVRDRCKALNRCNSGTDS